MPRLLIALAVIILATALPAAAQDAPTAAGCGSLTLPTGLSDQLLSFDGGERSFLLYIPADYDPSQPTPLVLSFHGFASNPEQQMAFSNWNAIADQTGIVVAYPRGTGSPLRWNTGQLRGGGLFALLTGENADDVGFVSALIDHLSAALCIDSARVYANGLSNGAGMSNRLACELANRITAVGGVAGAYNETDTPCQPSRPIPIIAFHGTEDRIVPFEGGIVNSLGFPSVPDWAGAWAARNECDLTPSALPISDEVNGVAYSGCADDVEVILYTVEGGGHTWPGSNSPMLTSVIARRLVGNTTQDIDATAAMWAFFQRYRIIRP